MDDSQRRSVVATREFPAVPESAREARRFAMAAIVDRVANPIGNDRLGDVELVVSELVTNGVLHGDGDVVEVTIERADDTIVVAVTSTSTTSGIAEVGEWTLPDEPLATFGRGLHIIQELSDDVVVDHQAPVWTVTVRFDIA